MIKIAPTNEILGTFLANANGNDGELQANPKSFIYSNYNVDIVADLNLVENTASQINLILPYYSVIDTATVSKETDEVISDVAAGFEIATIIAISIAAGIVGGVGVTAATAGTAAGMAINNK